MATATELATTATKSETQDISTAEKVEKIPCDNENNQEASSCVLGAIHEIVFFNGRTQRPFGVLFVKHLFCSK